MDDKIIGADCGGEDMNDKELAELFVKASHNFFFGKDCSAENWKKGVICLHKAIELGCIAAYSMLSSAYLLSDKQEDIEKGLEILRKGADLGNADCLAELGNLYFDGRHVEKDAVKAFEYWSKAAEKGHPEAMYKLGYTDGNNEQSEAIEALVRQAEMGSSLSCLVLGYMYYSGGGPVEQDYKKAYRYLKKCADCDDAIKYSILGFMYYHGHYVARNRKTALRFFKKAVKCGQSECFNLFGADVTAMVAEAERYLGMLYYTEEELIKPNFKKAFEYFSSSSKKGSGDAEFFVGFMYLKGDYVEANSDEAVKHFEHAAENSTISAYFVGSMYLDGAFGEPDTEKAAYYLQKAADGGNDEAQFKLAGLLLNEDCSEENIDKVLTLLKRSADQNNVDAEYALGAIYLMLSGSIEENTENNRETGLKYLKSAALHEQPNACFDLGRMYLEGDGIEQDQVNGLSLITKAACSGNSDAIKYMMNLGNEENEDNDLCEDVEADS
ncbi:sel1 repeat family protein [bacterium]|nr:sel1 repeat family protein [bacterium]